MFLIFALGRFDIASYGDLILRSGTQKLYQRDSLSAAEFDAILQEFAGIETLYSMTIWRMMD